MSEHPRRRIPLGRRLVSTNSYGSVLVFVLISYGLTVMVTSTWGKSVVLLVQMLTVWLALHVSHARRVVRIVANFALLVAAVAAVLNLFGTQGSNLRAFVFSASCVLYFIAPMSVLRDIVSRRTEVDQEVVLGAIDAYLLVGMFFAFLYGTIASFQPSDFFGSGVSETGPQFLFFSFTTLTTTGYGNLVPAGNPGQAFAVLEMLIGQLFLVTAVAKVINAWTPKRWRVDEGGSAGADAPDPPEQNES